MRDGDQFSVNLTHLCDRSSIRLYELLIQAPPTLREVAFSRIAGVVCCFRTLARPLVVFLNHTPLTFEGGAAMSFWFTDHYDWRVLLFAAALASLVGLSAIRLIHRAQQKHGQAKVLAVVVAAVALGCGVWSAHFAGMLAYQPGLAVDYDATLTLLSLFIATVIAGAGLTVAVYFPSWVLAAGALVGLGIAGMHPIAMEALQVPGHFVSGSGLTMASIVLGILFSMAALYVALGRDGRHKTVGAVALFTISIVAQHLAAIGSVEIIADTTQTIAGFPASKTGLAATIAGAMAFVSIMGGLGGGGGHNRQGQRLAGALDNLSIGLLIFYAYERSLVSKKTH